MTRQTKSMRARRLRAALAGELVGEALDPQDHQQLVCELHAAGFDDVELAEHTGWSTYTVGRIREQLGLAANGGR